MSQVSKVQTVGPNIRGWVILIGGFSEHRGESTGTNQLWRKLRSFSRPDVCVQFCHWNEDWAQRAAFIAENTRKVHDPEIIIAGYSWGAGYGARRLAAELKRHDLRVTSMTLCDPIYRSHLPITRWLALTRLPFPIELPSNVEAVKVFTQLQSRPSAHPVLLHGDRLPVEELEATHTNIDEHIEYHAHAVMQAASLLGVVEAKRNWKTT